MSKCYGKNCDGPILFPVSATQKVLNHQLFQQVDNSAICSAHHGSIRCDRAMKDIIPMGVTVFRDFPLMHGDSVNSGGKRPFTLQDMIQAINCHAAYGACFCLFAKHSIFTDWCSLVPMHGVNYTSSSFKIL